MATVKLSCPKCGQHYSVEIDPSLIYDDMDCPKCGGKIPVSANPPAAPDVLFKPGDKPDDQRLKCPKCAFVFSPLFDLESHVGGCDCPNCGSGMPAPLEQYLVNRKPQQPPRTAEKKTYSGPPPAAPFFCFCSVLCFIVADITSINDMVGLSNSLYWSGVSFILLAIYLKIPWK